MTMFVSLLRRMLEIAKTLLRESHLGFIADML